VKTTVELPDDLAQEAKRVAALSGTTLRSLVEAGLRAELVRRSEPVTWTPRSDLAYGSGGLTPAAHAMTWAQIREDSMQR
jgi:Arc/MetJ family transcription regulator